MEPSLDSTKSHTQSQEKGPALQQRRCYQEAAENRLQRCAEHLQTLRRCGDAMTPSARLRHRSRLAQLECQRERLMERLDALQKHSSDTSWPLARARFQTEERKLEDTIRALERQLF